MRRIISQLFVLLDGVMKAPEEWHFPYYDNWMAEVVAEQIDGADILLLGRATYQIFAGSWPQRGDEVPLATRINAMPKLVVSATLTSVAWQNTTVIAGDVRRNSRRSRSSRAGTSPSASARPWCGPCYETVCWTSCHCWSTRWPAGTADAGSRTAWRSPSN
jgi:hypothetical protein